MAEGNESTVFEFVDSPGHVVKHVDARGYRSVIRATRSGNGHYENVTAVSDGNLPSDWKERIKEILTGTASGTLSGIIVALVTGL